MFVVSENFGKIVLHGGYQVEAIGGAQKDCFREARKNPRGGGGDGAVER